MSDKIHTATHTGELHIGSTTIPVAVLEDGARVVTQRGMFVAIGMNKNPIRGQSLIDNSPAFVNAGNFEPFISDDLR